MFVISEADRELLEIRKLAEARFPSWPVIFLLDTP
jgi:hypothetical protein